MRTPSLALLSLCVGALFGTGCSKQEAAPAAAATASSAAPATPANATAVAAPAKKRGKACDIVTQAEMSTILGGAVAAAAGGNEHPPAATECIYASAAGSSAYAELEVDWGGGDPQTLGAAAGMAGSAGPAGSVGALKGLGDRAYQVTADQVFISTGGDLMMIRFPPGSRDVIAKARRIYETAKGRM